MEVIYSGSDEDHDSGDEDSWQKRHEGGERWLRASNQDCFVASYFVSVQFK